jgi:UDP-3-O-[3-hydroxymyristoyl] glucosamine N-acyltransferase
MEFFAKQIAELLGGEIEGNPEVKVNTVSKIEEGQQGSLTFLANPIYNEYIYTTKASVVIVNNTFTPEKSIPPSCTLIKVENAYHSFAKLLEIYNQLLTQKSGVEAMSFVAPTAKLGTGVYIGSFVYVDENAVIGNNVKIYPNSFIGSNVHIKDNTTIFSGANIYAQCKIGENCVLHSGVIIGGDGFGFAPNSENNYSKIPQIGNVVIEDFVEIGANSTIDRATLGSTIIRKGVKIDNLIQIAHNVEIGENTVIAAQTGVAGSTKIGKNCMIGGQVGIVGHITIADGVKIAAQSGIGASIKEENSIWQGSPAFSIGDYKRSYVGFKNLPSLKQKIDSLEKELAAIKKSYIS